MKAVVPNSYNRPKHNRIDDQPTDDSVDPTSHILQTAIILAFVERNLQFVRCNIFLVRKTGRDLPQLGFNESARKNDEQNHID
jgi:hypothetical protein